MDATPLTLTRLRRDRLLIWCWLPLGGLAMFAVVKSWQLAAGEPPPGLYTALDVIWIAVTFSLIWRRTDYREEDGARVMKQSEITVRIDLKRGAATTTVWTCDLSYDYVKINADYRS